MSSSIRGLRMLRKVRYWAGIRKYGSCLRAGAKAGKEGSGEDRVGAHSEDGEICRNIEME